MWKKWETVAETERNKITELADTYDVPRRDVASMFQSGMDFDEIANKLKNKNMSDFTHLFSVGDKVRCKVDHIFFKGTVKETYQNHNNFLHQSYKNHNIVLIYYQHSFQ